MKLQDIIKDISSVKNAFDISNFVKVEAHHEGNIYWFLSMQRFQYKHSLDYFTYTESLYNKKNAHYWEDIHAAFYELMTEINTSTRGNPVAAGSVTAFPTDPNLKVSQTKSIDPMFCSCDKPNLVKSNAGGEVFDYCKECKKEHKTLVQVIGTGSKMPEPDELYFF